MTEPANFSRLYADVQMHATGVLNPTGIQPVLFAILRDFCQHTNAWSQTQDIVVSASTQDYPLTFPTGSAIKRVLAIQDITNGVTRPPVGVFIPAQLVLPSTLRLMGALQNTYTWRVQTSLYPVDPVDANGDPMVPSWFLDDFQDTFFHGVLYRLLAQPAKTYSNGQMAATHYRLYMKNRGEAAAAVLAANMYNGQTWTYPRGGVVLGRQRGV